MNNAIVVIGYNNVKSIIRLLDSLNEAEYGNDKVPLIISVDNSGSTDVEEAAGDFQWRHGKKEVRTFPVRQGLKKHILSCGEYLYKYDALFIFEDDTLAAEAYYQYGKQCIEYYKDDERIAGISLYSHAWNQNANFPFEPIRNQYDTYFMQYAPSLGQIWLKKPWLDFLEWYSKNENIFDMERNDKIPAILYTWGKNSWLKFHIAYCAVEGKYFVYPYCSYTTDFVESGTHFSKDIARFQVNLIQGQAGRLRLAPLDEKSVTYDAFFESELVAKYYQKRNKKVKIDLYGCQPVSANEGLALTTQSLSFKVVDEYALQLRPIELNVLKNIHGHGIFLYDTSKQMKRTPENKETFYTKRWDFFMRDRFLMVNEVLPLFFSKIRSLIGSLWWRGRNGRG